MFENTKKYYELLFSHTNSIEFHDNSSVFTERLTRKEQGTRSCTFMYFGWAVGSLIEEYELSVLRMRKNNKHRPSQ